MAVATAIVGSAVVGTAATVYGAKKAGKATERGAATAAEATVESTRMQVDELRRQFDEQMKMLAPMIQQQYGAGSAFAQLLGFDQYDAETGEFTGGGPPRSGPEGFQDPNLSRERLASETGRESELGQQAFGNVLAGQPFEQDIYRQNVMENRLAPGTMQEDPRFQFARDTNIVGEDFRTSPGYSFAVEEAQKEVDRRNSVGGQNYGGRAMMEATRRIQGEADKEYYNWVAARQGDLSRQDQAIASFQQRQMGDIARGDVAMENFLGRRAGDLTRQDAAIARNEGMREFDLRRGDQAYYNYLNAVGGASGLGSGVQQAVGASQQTAGAVAGAYGQQGGRLSGIYQQLGHDQANIGLGTAANINNQVQGGIQNWMFARQAGI